MQRSTNMPTCEVGKERISGVGPKLGYDGQGYRYLAQAKLVDGPGDESYRGVDRGLDRGLDR
jgi:hypothetical protein